VSIVGFNNQEICLMTSPTMTSVDQQISATIDAAVDLLVAQMAHPTPAAVVRTIPPLLVQRGSTGPAPR
jgi:DNA-binding LacI/PurR family transcriptional regulator